VDEISKRIQVLDEKDDDIGLSVDERSERNRLLVELSQNRLKQDTIVYQKVKCKWLK